MPFFSKSKQTDGWRAISFQDGEVLAAHVQRQPAGVPVVSMIGAEAMNGSTPTEVLGRLSRSWQGQQHACTTVINIGSYQLLPVDAPNLPAAELKSAIAWTVTTLVDYSNEEATIDVLGVPFDKTISQRARTMYAVVTRSKLANDIQRCFQEAKLALKVIDIPEMAQRNIAGLLETEGSALALVTFDSSGGLLTFTSSGELCLARRILVTLQSLSTTNSDLRTQHQEVVALEIQRSLDHFARQFSWLRLERLVVAPIGNDDGGLIDCLSTNLDTEVIALDLASILDLSQVPELKNPLKQQKYLMTLGLALRHEEKVL